MPEAARVAAEVRSALALEPRFIEGRGGVFTIKADGKLLFSKGKTHRFPEQGEVVRLLKGQ